MVCGLWLWHMHAGLGLVALDDGRCVLLPVLDLVVLLDEGAARAPERHAAIVASAALDVVSFADLTTLDHGVTTGSVFVSHGRIFEGGSIAKSKAKRANLHPSAASEASDTTVDQAVRVQHIGALHRRVANPLRSLA